jgi:hypothetical protein
VAYDLTDFLGDEVELSISYVTDPVTGGVGAFVDNTRVVVDGVESADGFEGATSEWSPAARPAGSPATAGRWVITEQLNVFGGTSTEDTLLLGFGLEQLATPQQRTDLIGRALGGMID